MRNIKSSREYLFKRLSISLLALITVSCSGNPEMLDVTTSKEKIYANCEETLTVTIRAVDDKGRTSKGEEIPIDVSLSGADVTIIGDIPVNLRGGARKFTIISTFDVGDVKISASAEGLKTGVADFLVVEDYRDGDGDGFPDVVELFGDTDRLNFRRWFCAVGESQVYETNRRWADINNDCAGLIRFAYSEALKVHNARFFSGYSALVNPANPDIKKYNYPDVPLLGENIFRTTDGAFKIDDVKNGELNFSPSATAGHLLLHNVVSLDRGGEGALPGDLIFYFNPDNPKMPYHVMIFLGEWGTEGAVANINDENGGTVDDADSGKDYDWVVYHTGPRETDNGEMRKVRLSTLVQHPEKRWRPTVENENFLGYFRLKILN